MQLTRVASVKITESNRHVDNHNGGPSLHVSIVNLAIHTLVAVFTLCMLISFEIPTNTTDGTVCVSGGYIRLHAVASSQVIFPLHVHFKHSIKSMLTH